MKNNILLKKFTTPYHTAPFKKIKNSDFLPAFKQAIANTKKEIQNIVTNTESPTFQNTIEALEFSGEHLDVLSSIFFNLNAAETNPELQKIAQEVTPLLTEFSNDITLNNNLFLKVKAVYKNKSQLSLNTEQATLLEKKYKHFTRNGANLSDNEKEKLREIDKQLGALKLKFGENVLAETNNFELHVTNQQDLSGLPDGAIEAAKQLAESKQKAGWVFTLNYPSYIPFMKYASNRNLRKKLAIAFGAKAFQDNENNNENIIKQIAVLRHDRANLLGYQSHAHFVLEERMAKTPKKVNAFLNNLLKKAKPAAEKEFAQLQKFASQTDGIKQLQKWDAAYYSEKLKQKLFNLDDEALKPYFSLNNVMQGAFAVATKLYNLHFEKIDTIDTYHEEVETYQVTDSNHNLIAIFYADFFPREGKRNGAWMTSYNKQYKKNNNNFRPHVSIVCNFTRPTKTKPSLLSFNEVITLFHEFGHALHGMLANTTYPSLSGTSVYWDFVELPSQVLENWCYEEEALKLFAKHYQTSALIPMELVQKIKQAATFQQGMQTLRQLSFGLLDMSWHAQNPSHINHVKAHENEAFKSTQLYPDVATNCMSTSFSHIFQGGYAAGYYSYKWAEVLDADAFAYFKENGIFNPEIASKFKQTVLSQGGTMDPMDLYIQFRGKEPNPDALLKRAGLINN